MNTPENPCKNPSETSTDNTRDYLAEIFRACTDEELLERYSGGVLTGEAIPVAAAEISRRGIKLPPLPNPEASGNDDESIDLGNLQPLSPCATSTEALLLRARLEFCGIPALLRDENLGQAFPMPNSASIRVLVPEACYAEALEIAERLRAGAFALDERARAEDHDPE
ncbi:MAG: DUF2007 domain-containing protein [Betaproteobacteria bacterium]|nr:DUF2007 domain-containing protein [Betaproteobacteria bacterium]